MKFRYKVLLINIIIIVITLSVSGFFMTSRQNRLLMEAEIKTAVTENNLAESAIEYSLLDIVNSPRLRVEDYLPSISDRVSSGMLSSTTNLYVLYNSKILYSPKDSEAKPSDKLISTSTDSIKKYQIIKEGDKTYVYVSATIQVNNSIVSIITSHDITDTKKTMDSSIHLYELFILITLLVSGLLVYMITKLLTRPLEKLNAITDDFAKGNFDTRSDLKSQDEVGLLSDKFNNMADSVEGHIDELNDMIHRRDQFVADFTHEIKTPMTTIIGYADTIRSVDLPREDEVKAAGYIFSEGKRLEQMSSHLFDLIYLKDGKIPKTPVNTQALGEAVIETVLPSIENCGLTLEYDFESAGILCDSPLLKTAFINLLDNARKASKEGDIISFTGRLLEETSNTENSSLYEFVVEDHGIGIAPEDIDRICDEFYMVDKSRSRSEGGAGLGMSLVAAILKEHAADLKIESELGKGTRMIVTIDTCEEEKELD